MKLARTYRKKFARREEGRTNYVKRLAFLKNPLPRAVIRKSTNHIQVQFVSSTNGADKIIASAHTNELKKFLYNGHTGNIPAAYLVGVLAGKRFAARKQGETIIDIGIQAPILGTRLFAAVKGIQDSGITVHADEESFPKEDRLNGKHIDSYASKGMHSKTNPKQFSSYNGKKVNPAEFSKMVLDTKSAILSGKEPAKKGE